MLIFTGSLVELLLELANSIPKSVSMFDIHQLICSADFYRPMIAFDHQQFGRVDTGLDIQLTHFVLKILCGRLGVT